MWTSLRVAAILASLALVAAASAQVDATAHRAARSRVVVIVLENRGYGEVVGNPDAPFLNRLARRGALATRYFALAHPSLPNYLGLLGGSTFGIRDDCADCVARGSNLALHPTPGQAGRPIDTFGRPVRGLPRQVVSGGICDCEAAWRGAFLVHGSLTEPGRSMALEITCPGSEAALALVGAARRLKISAKAREVRGVDRVVIRDGEAIAAMLTRLGAHDSVLAWEERRMRREVRATANRLANFDDANLRRSARAAVAAGARVERALEILGTDAPDHLVMAGRLRVANRQASLEELGQLADPPLTKDAIAGRIRRLLAMADRRAADLGMPSTEAFLTADMLP